MTDIESRLAVLEAEVARLKEQLEYSDAVRAVRRGIQQMERGEGVPALEAIHALGRKYGLEKSRARNSRSR